MPKCCAEKVLVPLIKMYQFPSLGRKTEISVFPSPSKSWNFAWAVTAESPKTVNRAACETENPFAAPASWIYQRAKNVFPISDALSGIGRLSEAQPFSAPV